MQSIFISAIVLVFSGCSCSTLFSPNKGNGKASTSTQSDAAIRSSPARVQPSWQKRFETAVVDAGIGSEGWALFADSSMGHTGQQLVIRHPDKSLQICYAPAATNDCTFKALDSAKWQSLTATVQNGDTLGDRTVQTIDALNLEYVHVVNADGTLKPLGRVFFMADDKPMPPAYDQLMNSFTNLPK